MARARTRILILATTALLTAGLAAAPAAEAAAPPTVTKVAPNSGPTRAGARITVYGRNFTRVRAVRFGRVNGSRIKVLSSTKLLVTVPAQRAGRVDVRVITTAGASRITIRDRYTYIGAPAITSIAPATGPTAGGTRVQVTGVNFQAVTAVTFAGRPGTAIAVTSSRTLLVTAPAGTSGVVDVRVTTRYGTSPTVTADRYIYVGPPTVASVFPSSGPVAGGQAVTITGANFTSVTGVTFSGTPGTGLTVSSSTSLTVTTPAHTTGSVDVQVTGSYGTSAVSAADAYTYIGPPTVTSVSPSSGPVAGGSPIEVTGTNFVNVTSVSFGASAGTGLVVHSPSWLTVTTPAEAAGTVDVRVTAYGTSAPGSGDRFVFAAAPGPVTGLAATPAATSVQLSWTNPDYAGLTGVMIRRATGPTPPADPTAGTLVTDTIGTTQQYTDTGLLPATQYSYALFAHDAGANYSVAATTTTATTHVQTLSVVAGCGVDTSKPATTNCLQPDADAVDAAGNLYIADGHNSVVEKITPGGTLSIIAGTGHPGAPVPGPATASPLESPAGVAVATNGDLFIADYLNKVVEKVTPAGTLSIVAGNGSQGAPVPGPATASPLGSPSGVAVDAAGNLFIADSFNSVVGKVTPAGTLSIVAGNGTTGTPVPGPATASPLDGPIGVAVDTGGNLFIADSFNSVVEKVTPAGTLSVVAGNGTRGTPVPGPATASPLNGAIGVAVDTGGNLFIADFLNHMVETVTPAGTLSVVAGNGTRGTPVPGPATASALNSPDGVSVDTGGNLFIADTGNRTVEKVTPGGTLSIVAGAGTRPVPGPATASPLNGPSGVAIDTGGNLFIADSPNHVVERVTSGGTLSIVAGNGTDGVPVQGPATASPLARPDAVAVDVGGDLYIADSWSSVVAKVTPAGTLSIVAGNGSVGAPVPGPATASPVSPSGVAVDAGGNLFIADSLNSVVEKVTPAGTLSIVAGNGSQGAPVPGPATASPLGSPSGVAVDTGGNLFIADSQNKVVAKVSPAGTLSIVAGDGTYGAPVPGPATASPLRSPSGLTVDASGNLFIADNQEMVVAKVSPAGTLSVIAGNGSQGVPVPGPATASPLGSPSGLAVDASGNLFIADTGNSVVERVAP